MNKSLIIAISFMLFISACQSNFPTHTATPPSTETPIPTSTSTSSPTPDTYILALEKAQEFFGSHFEIKNDGKVFDKLESHEIPGFTIIESDGENNWSWQRVYNFQDNAVFTVIGTSEEIKILPDGGIDFFGWVYEIGEFQRQKIEFKDYGGRPMLVDSYSVSEFEYMIITNSSTNPAYTGKSTEQVFNMYGEALKVTAFRQNGKVKTYIRIFGMYEEIKFDNLYWFNNYIPVKEGDHWSKVPNSFFYVRPIRDRSIAFVAWYNTKDEITVVIVEGKQGLDIPKIFDPGFNEP